MGAFTKMESKTMIKTEPQALVEEIARLKSDALVGNMVVAAAQEDIAGHSRRIAEAQQRIDDWQKYRDRALQQAAAKEADLKRLLEATNDY